MTRPSARAVHVAPGKRTRVMGRPGPRKKVATTLTAAEADVLRILCNAALMKNAEQPHSLVRTPGFEGLHRKAIGLYDRAMGRVRT